MDAESEKIISQARQTQQVSGKLVASLTSSDRPAWDELLDAWKALRVRARQTRADSRNHRHVAVLRRAIRQKTTRPAP